jgi:peptidylprolyl isomerase
MSEQPVRVWPIGLITIMAVVLILEGCVGESTPPEPGSGDSPSQPSVQVPAVPAQSELASATKIGEKAHRISGLEYETTREGSGPEARPGDTVTVHYTGTLEDGTEFDSSRGENRPMTFELGDTSMILGFNEGIGGMKVGEQRRLTIPPNIGYGALGNLPKIPPNTTLVFDVELVSIGKPSGETATAPAAELVPASTPNASLTATPSTETEKANETQKKESDTPGPEAAGADAEPSSPKR